MAGKLPDIEAIFFAARHKEPQDRAAYLDEVCAGDLDLRRRVEQLVSAQAEIGSFLEAPASALVATIDPPITERPGTVIGPYKLLEEIGEGGFGIVFMAEQQKPMRRRVALKVLKPGMDTRQVVARFEAERQALALMDHPNIAQVHDGGETAGGRPYFVMELVKGTPITAYCDQAKLAPRQRLELFVTVCQAVQHAHQKGVIHRDLKPSNVLVALHDGTPVVKVIDFGIAKATVAQLTDKTLFTGFAQMIGTPLYMSPEQAGQSSVDIDTRSDIYSLGVLLYELLTGTTPFEKERLKEASYDEIRRIICEEEPPRPSMRIGTLGQAATTLSIQRQSDPRKLSHLYRGELDWIVLKALEKDRNRRYETASAFAADVQRYLHDEPVQACPPSALYRFKKFARRNKRALLTVAVLVLAVAATVVALVVDNVRVEDALTLATRKEKVAETALKQVEKALQEKSQALGEKSLALRNEKQAKKDLQNARDRDLQLSCLRRVALASHEIQANNVDRANQILDECVPAKGQADPRHWEWHYLKRQCQGPLFTIPGDKLYGHGVTFSPDGRRLAVGSSDVVFFLDAATGQPRRDHSPLTPWSHPLNLRGRDALNPGQFGHVTFSPDGQFLAAAGSDKKMKGAMVQRTPLVRIWHLSTGQEVATLRSQAGGWFHSVAFSPDSHLIAAASGDDRTVTIWDAATGRKVRSLLAHSMQVRSVAFSPDGKMLASAGGTRDSNIVPGEVELWDVATGQRRGTLRGHSGGINSLAFSRDGRLASASGDRTVRVWDPTTGRQLSVLTGHSSHVSSVAFSPDGKYLASGSSDTSVIVRAMGPDTQIQIFRGHTSKVMSVAFSPDSQRLASVDEKNNIKVWDVRTTPKVRSVRCAAEMAAFSPDSRRIAVATLSDLYLYDLTTSRTQVLFQGKGNFFLGNATSLAFSPDGKRLAAGNKTRVRRRDLTTGKEAPALPGGPRGMFSPNGRLLALANGNEIKVCDADTGKEIFVLRGHTGTDGPILGSIQGVSFSDDGKRLASISSGESFWYDGKRPASIAGPAGPEVKVWDLGSGQPLRTFRGPDTTYPSGIDVLTSSGVALSRDGRFLAASGDYVKVWDVTTGQELHSLRGHTGLIPILAFSPDGRRLVSASRDGNVILWDMATGQQAFSFRFPGREFCCVAFSPDGRRLLWASRVDWRDRNEGEVTILDAYETRPEVEAAFREGQKIDRQLRQAEQEGMRGSDFARWSLERDKLRGWLSHEIFSSRARRAVIDRGRSHSGRGQWQEAAAAFAEASKADPRAALAHQYERVAALLLAGDTAGYHQACGAALEHFAATTDPWMAQGVARMAMLSTNTTKDRAKFVRLAERAVAAHPQNGPWLQTLGAAHYRAGQYDQALSRLQSAEKAEWYGYPTVVNWLLLAQVHHSLGHAGPARKWLDKAAAWIDKATQRTPKEQAEALHLELSDLMACRLLRREAQLLITGKADDPPHILNETAWILATCADPKRRDPARAVALAQKAVKRAPGKAVYRRTLGVALYRAGDWKASAAALENAVRLSDGRDTPEAFFLAMAHWQLGDKAKAREWYDKASQWMEKNHSPKDELWRELRSYRAEAADLLGIKDTPKRK